MQVELLTPASLRERLKEQREGQAAWLVLLYASWSSACQIFDPSFGELADRYTQPDKLRFGKLEISRSGTALLAPHIMLHRPAHPVSAPCCCNGSIPGD